jgi:hypothetical protein
MTIVAGMPCSFAASAIACAWLPEENVITPRARASGSSAAIAL